MAHFSYHHRSPSFMSSTSAARYRSSSSLYEEVGVAFMRLSNILDDSEDAEFCTESLAIKDEQKKMNNLPQHPCLFGLQRCPPQCPATSMTGQICLEQCRALPGLRFHPSHSSWSTLAYDEGAGLCPLQSEIHNGLRTNERTYPLRCDILQTPLFCCSTYPGSFYRQ